MKVRDERLDKIGCGVAGDDVGDVDCGVSDLVGWIEGRRGSKVVSGALLEVCERWRDTGEGEGVLIRWGLDCANVPNYIKRGLNGL